MKFERDRNGQAKWKSVRVLARAIAAKLFQFKYTMIKWCSISLGDWARTTMYAFIFCLADLDSFFLLFLDRILLCQYEEKLYFVCTRYSYLFICFHIFISSFIFAVHRLCLPIFYSIHSDWCEFGSNWIKSNTDSKWKWYDNNKCAKNALCMIICQMFSGISTLSLHVGQIRRLQLPHIDTVILNKRYDRVDT